MTEEKIEQKVIVSDHARTGDINLVGKVVNIIKHPAEWQDIVFRFLSSHRYFLLVAAALEVLLLALYLPFRNLYLIPWWLWAAAAVSLLLAAWTWYTAGRFSRTPMRVGLAIAGTLAVGGITGWQGWQIARPPAFESQVFGIALAELGEGGAFRRTARTREITDQVYERLCLDIRRQFAASSEDPCADNQNTPDSRRVAVRRIGVISDSQTAHKHGQRIDADVVIWGQLLTSGEGGATIRFEVLTVDQAANPDFPVVMPVTTTSTEILASAGEGDLAQNSVEVKEYSAQQAIVISASIRGLIAYLDQNFPEAVRQLELSVDTIHRNPSLRISEKGLGLLYFYLGRSNYYLGRIHEGQEWLRLAQAANSQEPAVLIDLALGDGTLGDFESREENLQAALRLLNAWLQTNPNDLNALYDRALVHEIREQYANAALDYEALLQLDPSYYIAYIQLGIVTYKLGRTDDAVAWFKAGIIQAEEAGVNPAWAYARLGEIYEKEGQASLAGEAYQRAVTLNPKIDWLHFYQAQFLESQQQMDAALLAYQQLPEISHNKGWAYEKVADFYRRRGLLNEAVLNYQRAVNVQPSDPLLRTYLAEMYFELGDRENAQRSYEEAVRLNEVAGNYYVYASYAARLYRLGDAAKAAEIYERSLALRPVDGPVLLNLGQIYETLGNVEAAGDTYCRLVVQAEHFSEDRVQTAYDRLEALGLDC